MEGNQSPVEIANPDTPENSIHSEKSEASNQNMETDQITSLESESIGEEAPSSAEKTEHRKISSDNNSRDSDKNTTSDNIDDSPRPQASDDSKVSSQKVKNQKFNICVSLKIKS